MEQGELARGRRKLSAVLGAGVLATLTILIGAAGAPAADPEPFAGSDDIKIDRSDRGSVRSSTPQAAEGLSARLADLSSPRLDDAGRRLQAEAVSLPATGEASLQRAGSRLMVQARVDEATPALLEQLRGAGAEIQFVSDQYGTVDMAVPEQRLRDIAAIGGVKSVVELIKPMTNSIRERAAGPVSRIAAPCGGVTSEGDQQMRVAEARSAYEVDGTGVKVGVISDSYDIAPGAATRASGDVGSGDLPGAGNPCGRSTPVQVLAEGKDPASNIDEGRAMIQIVHGMAPGAAIAFSNSGGSEEAFANQIRALNGAGAQVIVDDVTMFSEPFFQDGPISAAVNEVTAAGKIFFSSAANSNVIVGGKNVGSFEAPSFRLAGGGPCVGSGVGCMDFDPGAGSDNCFAFTMQPGSFIANLQWAEPRGDVTTDLDFYLIDMATSSIVAGSENENATTQMPFEVMEVKNETGAPHNYCLVVNKFSGGGNPRLKFILSRATQISAVEYPSALGGDSIGPSIFGHNGAENAVSTAAVPYNNSGTLEDYSSYGPITITHAPVIGTTPAAALPSPQVLAKPDIAATDNNRTTFFQPTGSGDFRFGGTSAAAPHAAGVAALELQHNPAATPAEVKLGMFLTAAPVGSLPPQGTGAGLINAVGAVGAVSPPPPPPAAVNKGCVKAEKKLRKAKSKLKTAKKKVKKASGKRQKAKAKKKVKKAKVKAKKAKKNVKKAC